MMNNRPLNAEEQALADALNSKHQLRKAIIQTDAAIEKLQKKIDRANQREGR